MNHCKRDEIEERMEGLTMLLYVDRWVEGGRPRRRLEERMGKRMDPTSSTDAFMRLL